MAWYPCRAGASHALACSSRRSCFIRPKSWIIHTEDLNRLSQVVARRINRSFFEQTSTGLTAGDCGWASEAITSVRCSLSAIVEERTDAEQKTCKYLSFLTEIEGPDSGQNDCEANSHNFEHWRFGRSLPQGHRGLPDLRKCLHRTTISRPAPDHRMI
jgi:hypothetical protein